ncbi:hypothetical protein L7F22_009488 [Adiantum nelumboides]|nr:hypothetical protein [Adiantum nelumboides]
MRRSYLHIHILECWLNEMAIEESIQTAVSSSLSYFNVVACLYHGGEKLSHSHELSTTFIMGCPQLRWNELLTFPILLHDLPQEVRLNLALYHGVLYNSDQVNSKLVGWTNFCFVEENGILKSTRQNLKLWKDPPFYSCGKKYRLQVHIGRYCLGPSPLFRL